MSWLPKSTTRRDPRCVGRGRRPLARRYGPAFSIGVLAVLCVVVAARAGAESRSDRVAEMERINKRWEGAECRLKTHWKLGRKPNDGWYKSKIVQTSSDQFRSIVTRLRVRDRNALSAGIVNDFLIAGTRFRCLGFRFREKDLDNLYLAMRSLRGDVETELLVWTGNFSSKPDLKQLPGVERFLRLHVIDVTAPSEVLRSVPIAGGATSPGTPIGRAPAAANPFAPPETPRREPAADVVYRPRVEVLAVGVQPPTTAPGGQVQLVVNYSVSGLPEGASFEVSERRTLRQGNRDLTSSDAAAARTNGTYTSSLEATIPAAAAPGVYRLVVAIGLPGAEPAEGSALFEVVH